MKRAVIFFLCFSLFFVSFMIGSIANSSNYIHSVTGKSVLGNVFLYVFGNAPVITIDSPLNTTYNFAIGSNLSLNLNVSANENVSSWWYSLYDLSTNASVRSNVPFSPNISFIAARKSNMLTVYANSTLGEVGSKSVIYYVSVPNSAPILGNISPNLYACEHSSLSYTFNATDPDEDTLQLSLSPTTPFFIFPSTFNGQTFIQSVLFSGSLGKSDVGTYNRTISVSDGQYSDSKSTNITVIEINNIPSINPIGVQTIYSKGDGSNFFKQVDISDVESGNANSGNFSFNLTFLNGNKFFDVNQLGIMNVTGNSSVLGVYNLSLCATDQALPVISPNISLCSQNGLNNTVCTNFSLTVTDANRAPSITSYYPSNLNFNASDGDSLYFNLTTYDPDATVPDIYWYIDGSETRYTTGSNFDQFSYTFACNNSGIHKFKAEITDGLLNDSVTWTVSLSSVLCPVPSSPSAGGGGGGAGGNRCLEKWACTEFSTCQNTQRSLEVGTIGRDDYRLITDQCDRLGLGGGECGMQIKSCNDDNFCNTSYIRPTLLQACKYTSNPTCKDGIQNCHDGSCELLVDCGGPCGACPSCSDKIQNQGELGVDCGGPCPIQCKPEFPLAKYYFFQSAWFIWLLWILLIILLVILLRRLYLLIKEKREFERERRIQSIFRGRN